LIVDDKPENLFALEKTLQKLDVQVIKANTGNEALGLILDHDFCTAIVDVQMPEMDGYELVELMRSYPETATLPVIFVSAIFSDEYHHRKGYDAGAVDFLSKPFVPEILLSKVRVFIELYEQRSQLQDVVDELNQSNATLARRAMQLEISSKVGQQVTAILELKPLLTEIVRVIENGFGYSHVAIWLVGNSDTGEVNQAISSDSGMDISATGPSRVVSRVLNSGNLYISNEQRSGFGQDQAGHLLGSELVLPLRSQNEILGILDIQSERPNAFGRDDQVALQIIADQVAIAIRNARLYSQVLTFNEQLECTVQERTEELRNAYQTLEKLDKTKSDFIEVAAHELRTPLTLIQGYANMLEGMVSAVDGAPEMVSGIIKGEDRLLSVVNSMLDISRIDTQTIKTHKETVSLGALLQSLKVEVADSLNERQLSLTLGEIGGLPLIEADPDLMAKLLRQLIGNAIKFTPDGGKICIEAKQVPPGELSDLQVAALHVTIADTGIGIDPEQHKLIFEKFYQTGPVLLHSSSKTGFKGGGPGLGLAIANGIIDVHGGRIWVESQGHDEERLPGSTFHVLLPIK